MPVVIEEDYSDFDWDSTNGDRQFDPLPEGWYPVRIAGAEVKTVKSKDSGDTFQILALKMKVLDGHGYAGRYIFDDVFLGNKPSNRKRRALIWRRLGLVQRGAVKASISEDDLVSRECAVQVKIEGYKRKDGSQGLKNIVGWAGYKPIDELGTEDAGAGTAEGGGQEGADGSGGGLNESACPF